MLTFTENFAPCIRTLLFHKRSDTQATYHGMILDQTVSLNVCGS